MIATERSEEGSNGMDHHVGRGSEPPSTMSWAVGLLLGGALIQLGVQIAPDSYQVFGPYFIVNGDMVISWFRSISPFLLAAVVVLAADRWPAGRRQLLIAAAVMAAAGLLQMGLDIWWAIWETDPGLVPDVTRASLIGASAGAALATLAADALLAAGLWAARVHQKAGGTRAALTGLIALAGLVATGTGLWVVALVLGYAGSADYLWVSMVTAALTAAGFGALAAVAMAAVRIARRPDGMPEILIALGAIVTLVATAWTWSYPHIAPIQAWSVEASVWVFTIPNAAAALGMLAMIAGFGLGAVAARRGRAGGDPTA